LTETGEPQETVTKFFAPMQPSFKGLDKIGLAIENEMDANRYVEPEKLNIMISMWEKKVSKSCENINDDMKPFVWKIFNYIFEDYKKSNEEVRSNEENLAELVVKEIVQFFNSNADLRNGQSNIDLQNKAVIAFSKSLNDKTCPALYQAQLTTLKTQVGNKLSADIPPKKKPKKNPRPKTTNRKTKSKEKTENRISPDPGPSSSTQAAPRTILAIHFGVQTIRWKCTTYQDGRSEESNDQFDSKNVNKLIANEENMRLLFKSILKDAHGTPEQCVIALRNRNRYVKKIWDAAESSGLRGPIVVDETTAAALNQFVHRKYIPEQTEQITIHCGFKGRRRKFVFEYRDLGDKKPLKMLSVKKRFPKSFEQWLGFFGIFSQGYALQLETSEGCKDIVEDPLHGAMLQAIDLTDKNIYQIITDNRESGRKDVMTGRLTKEKLE